MSDGLGNHLRPPNGIRMDPFFAGFVPIHPLDVEKDTKRYEATMTEALRRWQADRSRCSHFVSLETAKEMLAPDGFFSPLDFVRHKCSDGCPVAVSFPGDGRVEIFRSRLVYEFYRYFKPRILRFRVAWYRIMGSVRAASHAVDSPKCAGRGVLMLDVIFKKDGRYSPHYHCTVCDKDIP